MQVFPFLLSPFPFPQIRARSLLTARATFYSYATFEKDSDKVIML
jgi:hypothetical protein